MSQLSFLILCFAISSVWNIVRCSWAQIFKISSLKRMSNCKSKNFIIIMLETTTEASLFATDENDWMFIDSLFTHLSALKTCKLMTLSIIIHHCSDICHSIWSVMIFLRIVASLIFEILNVNFIFEFNSCASVIFIWISSWTTLNWAFVYSNSCWQILMITLVEELSYQCFDDCVENSAKIKDILI